MNVTNTILNSLINDVSMCLEILISLLYYTGVEYMKPQDKTTVTSFLISIFITP